MRHDAEDQGFVERRRDDARARAVGLPCPTPSHTSRWGGETRLCLCSGPDCGTVTAEPATERRATKQAD